jgi:hypothetical protein
VRPQKVHKLLCRLVLVWFKLGNQIEFPDVRFGINLTTEERLLGEDLVIGLFLHSRKGVTKTTWTQLEENNLLVGTLTALLSFILVEDMRRCHENVFKSLGREIPRVSCFAPAVS